MYIGILSSYDNMVDAINNFTNREFLFLILNEAHRVKNRSTEKNQILSNIKSRSRTLLSGTPIQNSLEELLTIIQFTNPESISCPHPRISIDNAALNLDEIKTSIAPYILRRTKDEVLKELPPKNYITLFLP